jgi:hypothetical protein
MHRPHGGSYDLLSGHIFLLMLVVFNQPEEA